MRPHVSFAILAAGVACSGGPTTGPSVGRGGGGGPSAAGAASAVTIQDFAFSPDTVIVKAGGTVQWTNFGASAHAPTADDSSWTSGQIAPAGGAMGGGSGGTFSRTFLTAGTYSYHCANHTYMTGVVSVTP